MQAIARKVALTILVAAFLVLIYPFSAKAVELQRNLSMGCRGWDVTLLQNQLAKLGYFTVNSTGYFGPVTYNAVIRFEQDRGLTPDGVVTRSEWRLLFPQTSRQLPLRTGKKVIFGYYPVDYPGDKAAYRSLASFGQYISAIGVFSLCVDSRGNLRGTFPAEGVALANKFGVKSVLVLHNCHDGFFDQWLIHNLLTNQSVQDTFFENLLKLLRTNGLHGVNVDFENIPPTDRERFNSFLIKLASILKPAGYSFSVTVPTKTWDDRKNSWSGAFDYQLIGKISDYVVLMTYDEHWFSGKPGPIASLPWVIKVLDYAITQIPRHKILMGVAAYGYDWSARGTQMIGWIKMNQLINKYGWDKVRWDNTACAPYLRYWDAGGVYHEVWFENKYSLKIKLGLIKSYNLAGIGIWRLGFEDAVFWETVRGSL
jgi:spore germination protein YaaH